MADETAGTAEDAETDETAGTAQDSEDAGAEEVDEAPRDERREELLGHLIEALGDAVVASHIDPGRDLWARVSSGAWTEAAEVLRHRMGARYFGFLSAIDWMPSPFGRSMDAEVDTVLGEVGGAGSDDPAGSQPTGADDAGAAQSEPDGAMVHGVTGGESRFQLFARVADVGGPGDYWGITVKADVPDDTMAMPTWTNVYAGADWHERECWEMFGIDFIGHPGLRHIYLPGDFEGNPLRKDFPLVARMVKPWPGIVDVEPLPGPDDEGSP